MFQVERTTALAGVGPKASLISPCSNSSDNTRPLTLSGTRNATDCSALTIRVTFYDANGATVGSPVGPSAPSTIEDPFWEHSVPVPDDAMSSLVEIMCGGVIQQTIPGVGFVAVVVSQGNPPQVVSLPPVFTAAANGNSLVMTVNNPDAAANNDSDTLVVVRHTGHGTSNTFLPHYHTPHPGSGQRKITYGNLSPGRYTAKLVHVTPTSVKTFIGPVVKIV